ncbi:serine/threonine-protein kinase [Actinomadura sediminis]|uniref:Serine/threonine-protein kinase n=1 Tax=Actinomadura sediminis TaxID=1038904 RepID=A0ABW3EU22_9ACTN
MEPLRQGDPCEVGPYRLEGRLGGGGMGRVFLGRSRGGRSVAVKVVRPELADDAGFRRRFALEVEAARRVGGFYTAQVVDAGPDADPPWLVTAYVPGPSLHQAVSAHGPLPPESVAVLGAGLAEGLAAVHACGLVHRDLKPSNVILADDGPRIIDFGISRALDATSHTRSQAVVGTPSFMSPEQARGREIGPASDVFSLACVLAFAATGRSPFGTGPAEAVVYRIVHDEPDLAGLPGHLVGLVRRCLAKDPGARPDLADVLDELADPARATARWLPPPVATMVTERLPAVTVPAHDAGERPSRTSAARPDERTGPFAGPAGPAIPPPRPGGGPFTAPAPAGPQRTTAAAQGGATAIAATALAMLCLPGLLGMMLMGFNLLGLFPPNPDRFEMSPFTIIFLLNLAIAVAEAAGLARGASLLSQRDAAGARLIAVTAGVAALHGMSGIVQFFLTGGEPDSAAASAILGVFVAAPLTAVAGVAATTTALLPSTRRWCLPRH